MNPRCNRINELPRWSKLAKNKIVEGAVHPRFEESWCIVDFRGSSVEGGRPLTVLALGLACSLGFRRRWIDDFMDSSSRGGRSSIDC